jgi:hypothetical protein
MIMLKNYTMKWVLSVVIFLSMLGTGFAQIGALEVSAPASVAGTYAYVSLPACWGGVANGICGDLVLAQDTSTTIASACSDLTNAADIAGKIAVVDRGVCGFTLKALNAQNAGAIAVVVVNSAAAVPAALGDAGQGSLITIPVIMLSQTDGNLLKAEMASSTVTACMTLPTVDVTFTVDMSSQTVSPNGVHIAGNFQGWDPAATAMTDNGDGTYSYTASLYTTEKLEYKFINGNDWPDAETVFAACSNAAGNRAYCVTTAAVALPTVCFNACGSCDPVSITFSVDMSTQTVSANGVHIAGNFQGWDPGATLMTDNGDGTWSYTADFLAGQDLEYKFINGNAWGTCGVDQECLDMTAPCTNGLNDNRHYVVTTSTILATPCYNSCDACPADLCSDPSTLICDNFDAYTAGGTTAGQAPWWSVWTGGQPGDISDAQSNSPSNSMLITGTGTQDVLLLLGNQATGNFKLSWNMYVEDGKVAYYNIQNEETPGIQWNLDVFFGADATGATATPGTGVVSQSGTTFTYPLGTWFPVVHSVDLDNDVISYYVNGVLVDHMPFTGNLGGIDYYSINADNYYYVDDVEFRVLPSQVCNPAAVICDGFESYDEGTETTGQAPWWSLWTAGGPGGTINTDQAAAGNNSMNISGTGLQDVLLLLGNQTAGNWELSWKTYVPDGAVAYWNIQESETPGVAWNAEVSFGTNNTGTTSTPGVGIVRTNNVDVSFNFTAGTWIDCVHRINLDNNTASYWIGGTQVTSAAYAGNLGSIDFFSINAANNYYIDEVQLIALPPTPANDDCGGSVSIQSLFGGPQNQVNSSGLFNNNNATTTGLPAEGHDCWFETELQNDMWFTFTGDGSEYYLRSDICNATDPIENHDCQFALYEGTCGGLTPVACNDDGVDAGTGNWYAELTLTTTPGTVYYLLVDGYDGSNGEYCLQVTNLSEQVLRNVTLEVDFTNEINAGATISANGVHVAGSFQSEAGFPGDWDPATTEMTLVSGNVYSVTVAIPDGVYEYKFINGNAWGDCDVAQECLVAGDPCGPGNNDNRQLTVSGGDIIESYCYDECVNCDEVGTNNPAFDAAFSIQPNPANTRASIIYNLQSTSNIAMKITNNVGQLVYQSNLSNVQNGNYNLNLDGFTSGVYFVYLSDGTNFASRKLVVTK